MGYTTDFYGKFNFNQPLQPNQIAYLKRFSETRRMKRDYKIVIKFDDPIRLAVDLNIGPEGSYYVGAKDSCGQDHDKSIIDYNVPPGDQPSLWCGWVPTDDGLHLEWNGVEKFYNYAQWLKYLISDFVEPWGYVLNGKVDYQGEEPSDCGMIIIKNNNVRVL